MGSDAGPYYGAYERRYRDVYAQGVECWTAFPREIADVRADVDRFLGRIGLPAGAEIAEFGCGEGFFGEHLAARGFRYVGFDIAQSALDKARKRLERFGEGARVLCADITDLRDLPDANFDAAVDIRCLHLLVVDGDRRRYLAEACRALRPGASMLFLEGLDPDAPDVEVNPFERWLAVSEQDVVTSRDREARHDGRKVTVRIPDVASRPRSIEQYRREVEAVGMAFSLSGTRRRGDSSVTFVAREPETGGN